jgi:hypothetical protein
MPSRVQLKHPSGWFAAGREVQQAAVLLSDGAFKLFLWLCLYAERTSGILQAPPADLARALRKSEAAIALHLEELQQTGICQVFSHNRIAIRDRFWPYERVRPVTIADAESYVTEVGRMFLAQACVRSSFPPADHKLAADWNRRGVSLQCVERAILLGTLRKYVALLNHTGGTPITTLHYYSQLLEEVAQSEVSVGYWQYLSRRIKDFELRWRRMQRNQPTSTADQRETK